MLWIAFAVAGATLDAAYSILVKRYVGDIGAVTFAAGTFLCSGTLLLAASAAMGTPTLGDMFYPAVLTSAGVNTLAATLYYRALQTTDISLAVPMIAFTPLFLIVTSAVMLGEFPDTFGLIGIASVAAGAYVLTMTGKPAGLLDPFRKMRSDAGILAMLAVAFLFSIGANADKLALLNSDPLFGTACILTVMGVVLGIAARNRGEREERARQPLAVRPLLITGAVLAAGAVSINLALSVQIVPYVISMKRLSILMTVLYGGLILREGELHTRFPGAAMMAAGAAVLILF
ncbi:hypothetical protein FGU65_06040 [Methanoculleus sp. FWC-SCC1]|uniref:EamA domain-containing protein n=1 Tax=Methanoculleus frigidifontis TaxID=2584085 RepID=A0ABT8M948_9EURY|nr:DMT family transporter [Methanoculleus sp. FWC-SCC1]MDN7024452.1 hypothetical protein [Methanoculleus sp. FWC-SCC1]